MNLVFASGFLVPQGFPLIEYFRGVQVHLQGRHQTLFPGVPPLGTSDVRARMLADAIDQKFPNGPIHIIAHSMAGMDSRILIAANHHGLSNPGRIASLTTLSTPHRGSPVADLLAGPKPDGARRIIYDGISQAIGALGIPTGALADLTAHSAAQLPDVAATHKHIRYRSYFGAGRTGLLPTCFALAATHHYIRAVTGEDNDGLVALDSAQYGEFQQPFWRCDHADMVGHDLDTLGLGGFRFDHLAAIDDIISRL